MHQSFGLYSHFCVNNCLHLSSSSKNIPAYQQLLNNRAEMQYLSVFFRTYSQEMNTILCASFTLFPDNFINMMNC